MSSWYALAPTIVVCGIISCLIGLPNRFSAAARLIMCAIAAFLLIRYSLWRSTETLSAPAFTFESLWQWGFYLLELLASLSGLIALVTLSRTRERSNEATENQAWLANLNPSIDMLIATYNEERDILERTIIGARGQDYPNFRVFVLDDGDRPWLEDLCRDLGVSYLTRPEHSHAKSGNMNNAVAHLSAHGGLGDFIAVLDADFIAQPDFLKRAAALFRDKEVGIVQTPQHFFNADPIQHTFGSGGIMPDEQRFFFDVMLPAKDAWGTAFCCGTSSICRREALMDVGGFPVESITEDMLLSIKMRTKGWRTVYLNEKLSFGLAPEGLSEYVTQRGRWCIGLMQIVVGPWGPLARNNLRFMDRLGLVDAFLFWAVTFAFKVLCLLVPTVYWLTGVTAIATTTGDLVYYLVPCVISQVLVLSSVSRGRILPILTDAAQLLVAIDIIRASAIGIFFPKKQKFKVTDKGGDRTTLRVHWGLLRRFVALGGIMLAAMFYAYYTQAVDFRDESSTITLVWTYYAFVILAISAMTCIELPRSKDEVFECNEAVEVFRDGFRQKATMTRISLSSAVIASDAGLPPFVALRLDGVDAEIAADVTEFRKGQYRLKLRPTTEQYRQLIARIFSAAYISRPEALSSMAIYSKIGRGFFLRPAAG